MSKQNKKFQFKGKQILLLGLVALVITAGYYRWNIEKDQFNAAVPTAVEVAEAPAQADGEGQDNGGGSEDITKLRQERDASRGQSVEEWTKISKDSNTSAEGKKEAEKKISAEAENADKERKIETQVKAKGYQDCIAYVDDGGVAVTVKGGDIDGAKVAQIKDIIVSVTNVPVRNIKINAI